VTCWDVEKDVAVGWGVEKDVAVDQDVVTCEGVETCEDYQPCCDGGTGAHLTVWGDAVKGEPASCEETEKLCAVCVVTEDRRGGGKLTIFVNFVVVVVELWEVDVEIVGME